MQLLKLRLARDAVTAAAAASAAEKFVLQAAPSLTQSDARSARALAQFSGAAEAAASSAAAGEYYVHSPVDILRYYINQKIVY